MDFYIKQNSTYPHLSLKVRNTGFNDVNEFYEKLQNATITFSMENTKSCKKAVICREMLLLEDCNTCNNCPKEFSIVYPWRQKDTKSKGRFEGKIEVNFLDDCGVLILPILEKLYINII